MMEWGRVLFQSNLEHALPRGVSDRFYEAARQRRALEEQLAELFRRWGYREFIPPMFEYAETLSTEANQLESEMYRFVDRDGQTLALRPDMTIPTARLAGSKLYDQPFPQRFFYRGSVFRYAEPQAGRQREFTQAGIELIGAAGAAADGESIILALEALRTAGLRHFRLTLGQMAFIHGLLAELELAPPEEQALLDAIDRKSQPNLLAILGELRLTAAQRRAVQTLPTLTGEENVLARAEKIALNKQMRRAVENLAEIEAVLDGYQVKEAVSLDLAEVRGRKYYTGITFECFAEGFGDKIGSGGRYDHLVERFGPARPAVGFALNVDSLLYARRRQDVAPPPTPPRIFAQLSLTESYIQKVAWLRGQGFAVRNACRHYSPEALRQNAAAHGEEGVLLFDEASGQAQLWWHDWPAPRPLTPECLAEVKP